jgi:hypothetical protein
MAAIQRRLRSRRASLFRSVAALVSELHEFATGIDDWKPEKNPDW